MFTLNMQVDSQAAMLLIMGLSFSRFMTSPVLVLSLSHYATLGSFSRPRRQRRQERHQTKSLMSSTMSVHVRFDSWYISLRSSAKQQHEMTKFYVIWRTQTALANSTLSVHVKAVSEQGFR